MRIFGFDVGEDRRLVENPLAYEPDLETPSPQRERGAFVRPICT
jgi:hypothetical protein